MQRVGRHTVVREVGVPGLVATYEARHDDGRPVCLRVVAVGVDPEPRVIDRFEKDVAIAAGIDHPGIVSPIEWSARDPIHVSTLAIRAASVADVRERAPSHRVEASVAAGIGAEVAEALGVAHSLGLVHAALAPESVLLGTDGQARITDFGFLKLLASMSASYSQVMRGAIEYLAPEQLSTSGQVGPATDVFGLGVMLYRISTGQEPFEAPSALGVSIRMTMGKPTPIDSHGLELPSGLSQLVMKMIAKAPADRPSTNDVVRELRAIAQSGGAWRNVVRRLAEDAAPPAPSAASTASVEPSASVPASSAAKNDGPAPTPPVGAPQPAPAPSVARIDPGAPPPKGAPALAPIPGPAPSMSAGFAGPPPAAPPPAAFAPGPPMTAPATAAPAAPSFAPVPSSFAPPPMTAPAPAPAPARVRGEDEGRPTLRDATAFLPDADMPDYLENEPSTTVDPLLLFGAAPDASEWPRDSDVAITVPKTVVMQDPRGVPVAAGPAWKPTPAPPAAPVHDTPPPPAREVARSLPPWILWAGVAVGAITLLVATVTLTIVLAG